MQEVESNAQADHITFNFLKFVFHKFYLVYSWIVCLKYNYHKEKQKAISQVLGAFLDKAVNFTDEAVAQCDVPSCKIYFCR